MNHLFYLLFIMVVLIASLVDAFLLPATTHQHMMSKKLIDNVYHHHTPSSSVVFMNKRAKRKPTSAGGGFGKKRAITNNIRTKTKSANNPNFVYAGSITPHEQSPTRIVDPDKVLAIPDYAIDGVPKRKGSSSEIEIKSEEEIVKMRAAGKCAREVLDLAGVMVKEGITTDEIDAAVHEASIERGAYPSPLNYRNFPKSCCTSVNEGKIGDAHHYFVHSASPHSHILYPFPFPLK